jgi:hypothetical protein
MRKREEKRVKSLMLQLLQAFELQENSNKNQFKHPSTSLLSLQQFDCEASL